MAAGHDQDKTEPATDKKKADARKKGQIAKSREIPSVAILLSAMTVFYFAGGWMFNQLGDIMIGGFTRLADVNFGVQSAHIMMWQMFKRLTTLLAPLLAVVIFAGIASNVAQVGFMLTGETLSPKFSKFNPIKGIKSMVSMRSLVEVVKAVLKILIIGGTAYGVLQNEMDQMPGLMEFETAQIMAFTGSAALKLGFYTCLILILLAGIDYVFQRYQHEKDLRMSKQEIKDEYRQKEGDPQIKSRIRAVQREMAMRRMMDSVPDATVVITNPTHLAVAIKFDRSMPAPLVVAKGAGLIAEKIKKLARENDVPVIEQKPLARAIFKNVAIDQYIPADLYHTVAELLAYVYRLKGLVH